MTDQFKGLTVKVVLSDGTSVIGLVTDVVNGQLSLSDGNYLPALGSRVIPYL